MKRHRNWSTESYLIVGEKIFTYWENEGNLKVTKLEEQSMKCPKYIYHPI